MDRISIGAKIRRHRSAFFGVGPSNGRRSKRPPFRFHRCPQVADFGEAFADVVEAEVVEFDSGFDFFPRHRR